MADDDERALELEDSKTYDNLKQAFAAGSQAASRCGYFAARADQEGHLEVSDVFRAVSKSKSAHAQGHLDFLREVADPQTGTPIGASEQNLRSAIVRATYEYETLFPAFARTAREEGFDVVGTWFETLAEAGRNHVVHLQRALERLERSYAENSDSGL